jgi:hypothetical protein
MNLQVKLNLTLCCYQIALATKGNNKRQILKPGGLDWSRRDLDRDLDLDAQKISVSTVEKILTVFKS